MSATDNITQPSEPVELWKQNFASMTGQAPEVSANINAAPGYKSIGERFAQATGLDTKPQNQINLTSAVVGPSAKVGTPELLDRAYGAGALMKEPGPVAADQGSARELGSQVGKLGMEAGIALLGAFKTKEPEGPEAKIAELEAKIAAPQPAPQVLTLG